jgi:TetR/AcrR family transcriptional regulator, regulator of biofilm formation and stress response
MAAEPSSPTPVPAERGDTRGPEPAGAGRRGRTDPRGEQRRAELLDAAIRLIGSRGIDAITHRAVAAEAGVSPASTTYYFRSKDELIDEALRRVTEGEISRLRERRAALGGVLDDLDVVVEGLAAWVEEQLTEEGRVRLLAQYHLQIESARRPEAREILEAWKDGTDELAETAMAGLGAADPVRAAILLVAAIDGLRLRLLASGHEPLAAEELRAVLRALLTGLTGRER